MFPSLFVLLTLVTSGVLGKMAIDPEREKLLVDAVGGMTFRRNGQLLTSAELKPLFVTPVKKKYVRSKFYRTFVIAFQKGVLPGLTLKEGDACDPSYTEKYKDPTNSSVTWHYQKNFTFDSYEKRRAGGAEKYCDYRQGLICKSTTKKCQCPEGSSMQAISPSSSVKRCLLNKGEICAIMDLDHGNDLEYSILAGHLHHLIFNLEKPPSCAPGTTCRFKDSDNVAKCYDVNAGPFLANHDNYATVKLDLGDECTLGLYARPGMCTGRNVCYNFGPPKSLSSGGYEPRTGFCAPEQGRFGLSDNPWVTMFVHQGTVPLRGSELRNVYATVLSLEGHFLLGGTVLSKREGGSCSVEKTKKMEDTWKYFTSLEGTPPPGKDYVEDATPAKLEANVQSLVDMEGDHKKKICQVFWVYDLPRSNGEKVVDSSPMKCVPSGGPPDADGNDGTCQKPGNLDTQKFAEDLFAFQLVASKIQNERIQEKKKYSVAILRDNPEPPCDPQLGPLPTSREGRHHDPDTLKGGACPEGSVCYQDFSDAHELFESAPTPPPYNYDKDDDDDDGDEEGGDYGDYDDEGRGLRYSSSCNLRPGFKQSLICHETSEKLGPCEKEYLEEKIDQVLKHLGKYGVKKLGEACHYEFEKAVMDWDQEAIDKMGYYQLISWLEKEILCDVTNRLECGKGGTCEKCLKDKCKDPEAPKKKREEEKRKREKGMQTAKGGAEGMAFSKKTGMMSIVLALIIIH